MIRPLNLSEKRVPLTVESCNKWAELQRGLVSLHMKTQEKFARTILIAWVIA
jgi:hypothetical protein